MPTDSRSVANYLLVKARAEENPLTPLQLVKLVYISHGWTLGLTQKPLSIQSVYAWPYGPVIPEVYHAFKQFGNGMIDGPALYFDLETGAHRSYVATFSPIEKEIVDKVWVAYKAFSGPQLSTITHRPGTPWATVTAGIPSDRIRDILIPNEIIRDHYRELALRNKATQEASGGGD